VLIEALEKLLWVFESIESGGIGKRGVKLDEIHQSFGKYCTLQGTRFFEWHNPSTLIKSSPEIPVV
jgi:hypothetical protein